MTKEVANLQVDEAAKNAPANAEGAKPAAKKEKKKKGAGPGNAARQQVDAMPIADFVAHRLRLWDEWDAAKKEAAQKNVFPIEVKLKDGSVHTVEGGVTTPNHFLAKMPQAVRKEAIVATLDGEYHDLFRPLDKGGLLEIHSFDSPQGKHCFWHSSAHILGQAMERHYGGLLCTGPALENGFYYDMFMADRAITPEDVELIELHVQRVIGESQTFSRMELTIEEARAMFSENRFKLEIIQRIVDAHAEQNDGTAAPTISAYRNGELVDLCRGPHIASTGLVKGFACQKASSAYWNKSADNESVQRLYGVSFPKAAMLKEYLALQEEKKKRDHRIVGSKQELFFFHPLSPGSAFMLPHGCRIYNTLMNFIKSEYMDRGYTEVMSPNMYNVKLWQTSGHYQFYKDNMFCFDVEGEEFALKPMNCPGHCVLFDHRARSYRELPMRIADFGVLHRNELSGTLTGLTRVRRFCQDDAHIFCTSAQVADEVLGCLDFMKKVYGTFGMTFTLALSTRPAKRVGEDALWDQAEAALATALNAMGEPWEYNVGDGAFYGPKIDIEVSDCLGRQHQCATIQLDFNLPRRFNLKFAGEKGEEIPVMVHRAMLGSVERLMAVLIEHTGGKWPFWLSPRQAIVVPVSPENNEYCKEVNAAINAAGFYCDVDLSDNKLNKKVREAQLAQYNFILVAGKQEALDGTVNVRTRDNQVHGERSLAKLLEEFADLRDSRVIDPAGNAQVE